MTTRACVRTTEPPSPVGQHHVGPTQPGQVVNTTVRAARPPVLYSPHRPRSAPSWLDPTGTVPRRTKVRLVPLYPSGQHSARESDGPHNSGPGRTGPFEARRAEREGESRHGLHGGPGGRTEEDGVR